MCITRVDRKNGLTWPTNILQASHFSWLDQSPVQLYSFSFDCRVVVCRILSCSAFVDQCRIPECLDNIRSTVQVLDSYNSGRNNCSRFCLSYIFELADWHAQFFRCWRHLSWLHSQWYTSCWWCNIHTVHSSTSWWLYPLNPVEIQIIV